MPPKNKKTTKTETRILLVEAGSTGLKEYSGFVSEAYNLQYAWPAVSTLYTRLRRSDSEMLMVGVAFSAWGRNSGIIVDLPDKPTDAEKEYTEFVYQVFDDIEGGATGLIETMVRRTPFDGFYVWEAVPGRRDPNWTPPPYQDLDKTVWPDTWRSQYDDGRIGFRRFSPRDTSTFSGWEFDGHKRAVAMVQQDFPNPSITLPLNQCLHLTFGDTNNPEGMSPLEGVARLERLKYNYEIIMGIGFEHAAGYLNVQKTSTGSLTPADKQDVREAARSVLTAQEGNYALWPNGMQGTVLDVSFAAAASILETVKYYAVAKLAIYMMQFIAYNIFTRTGALSSATDSSQVAVFTFNAMMDGFAAQLDAQIGRRLFAWNKDSFPGLERRPKIRFRHVEKEVALSDMGVFFSQLNGILPLGEEDYRAIRKRSGFMPENLPAKIEQPARPPVVVAPETPKKNLLPEDPAVEQAMERIEAYARVNDPILYEMLMKNEP